MIARRARLWLAMLLLVLGGATPGLARAPRSETERNRAIISAFAHQFYDQRDVRGAFERWVVPNYIQHNPGLADGRDAAIAALEPMFSSPGSVFEVKRIIVDGDMAVIHLRGRTGPDGLGGAVADIYRLKGGKIVEHWDIIQLISDKTTNPHPYF